MVWGDNEVEFYCWSIVTTVRAPYILVEMQKLGLREDP